MPGAVRRRHLLDQAGARPARGAGQQGQQHRRSRRVPRRQGPLRDDDEGPHGSRPRAPLQGDRLGQLRLGRADERHLHRHLARRHALDLYAGADRPLSPAARHRRPGADRRRPGDDDRYSPPPLRGDAARRRRPSGVAGDVGERGLCHLDQAGAFPAPPQSRGVAVQQQRLRLRRAVPGHPDPLRPPRRAPVADPPAADQPRRRRVDARAGGRFAGRAGRGGRLGPLPDHAHRRAAGPGGRPPAHLLPRHLPPPQQGGGRVRAQDRPGPGARRHVHRARHAAAGRLRLHRRQLRRRHHHHGAVRAGRGRAACQRQVRLRACRGGAAGRRLPDGPRLFRRRLHRRERRCDRPDHPLARGGERTSRLSGIGAPTRIRFHMANSRLYSYWLA